MSEHREKECFCCHEVKPLDSFYKHKQMKDGHLNKCKECAKKHVRDNYYKNLDHYKEYDKKRAMTEKRIAIRRRYRESAQGKMVVKRLNEKSKKKFPKRFKAREMINNRVASGVIIKPDVCSECGESCNPHGHHDDYDKPLSVRWLCPKCHTDWHKENEPVNG